jgi:F0F1-type ATP synthase delta subunit
MRIQRNRLADDVASKTHAGKSSKKLAQEVAAYLLENGQTSQLAPLMRDVWERWAELGRVEVVITSAREISPKVRADIKARVKQQYPKAKTIVLVDNIDPSVKGGVKLELPNSQLDLTIETKLNRFKQLATAGSK